MSDDELLGQAVKEKPPTNDDEYCRLRENPAGTIGFLIKYCVSLRDDDA